MKSILSLFLAASGLVIAWTLAPAAPARADDGLPPPAAPGATTPVPPSGRFFDTYDTNLDGKVTKEEFLALKGDEETFTTLLDKNGDGVITLDELGLPADYKPQPRSAPREEGAGGGGFGGKGGKGGGPGERLKKLMEQFQMWDTDKDGKVSKEEYKGEIPFERADFDHDGFLTMEDLKKFFASRRPGGMPNPEQAAAQFKEVDKNGDGKVTADEFQGPPERFQELDANKDGAISLEEFQGAFKAPPGKPGAGAGAGPGDDGKMMKRFDKNGDGKVSREEFPGSDETFKDLDKNGDGFISDDELPQGKAAKAFRKNLPPKGSEPASKPGDPPMVPPPGAGGEMPPPASGPGPAGEMPAGGGLPPLFAALDHNHDGKISRDEFPGSDEEWRHLDRDGNGWVTPDEAR